MTEPTFNPAGQYLKHLEGIFNVKPEFYREEDNGEDLPAVSSIIYQQIPEPGMITGFTYGLSLANHPAWEHGRPELTLTVRSEEAGWGAVAGYLANGLRGNCPFSYGNTIRFGQKIAPDSDMDAFLVFAPSIFEQPSDYQHIDIGAPWKISIAALYPIYDSEVDLIDKFGLEKFWHHEGFDMYDVTRKPIETI